MNALKSVLFLCSGNYYRSRVAEHLFNALADEQGLLWIALSRGLRAGESGNAGPISAHAVEGLAARGIRLNGHTAWPRQVTEEELRAADLVVAMKKAEHRPLLAERFPDWPDAVEYWHIDDVEDAAPAEALVRLDWEIDQLAARLATGNRVCRLCLCAPAENEHHFIPRTLHSNKWFQKNFSRNDMRRVIAVCKPCHSMIHALVPDEKELGRSFNTKPALLAHPRLAEYLRWQHRKDS